MIFLSLHPDSGAVTESGWEYLFVQVEHRGDDVFVTSVWGASEDVRFDGLYLHTGLQSLGAEGWELAGIDTGGERPWYVLKRPDNVVQP